MTTADHGSPRDALAVRLRAIAAVLLTDVPDHVPDPAEDAARVLTAVAENLVAEPTNDRLWLVLTGVAAAYPTRDEVDEARRFVELSPPEEVAAYLLEAGLARARSSGEPMAPVEVVAGRVIVDVDFTARHDLHSGIQRVVRQTMPYWNTARQITPAAWTRGHGALRFLDPVESARIYDWFSPESERGRENRKRPAAPHPPRHQQARLIIPWECVIALPEVPPAESAIRIAAIGAYSNNRVVAIGYDTIPLVSADTVGLAEPTKFMPYLAAIKFADRIAGISDTAAQEFLSFTSMLGTQGLSGPDVISVPLPAHIGDGEPAGRPATAQARTPSVVVVGTHDQRKNHLAVLHAAETLWQSGLEFSLTFIGSGGSNVEFFNRVEVLQHRGRPVEIRTAVGEVELQAAVTAARFTVFPSIHEGYGLPVAESLALGTPVITTDYGSTAEIAADGGALTVDPRDDASIAEAMRLLLVSDAELARLQREIGRRAERSWQDYADELWVALVEPVLAQLSGSGGHEGR